MKYFKTYESFLNEAKRSKVFVASKKGSYPATIVVIKNKKVIHQEQVNTPEAIPAAFNVLQKKYPRAIITVEDKTGATLYREVDEKKAYMTKIDLKDFKAIKKGTKVKYMGADAEVVDNNGFVLTLKQNGKKFTVNKSMFDHGGMISEMISEGITQMAKKAYMALKKHFGKSVFGSGPSKLFNIVEPSDSDYEYAVDWVKKNGAKGDKIYMSGTDEILNKIHIAYGQPNLDIQSPDIAEVSIDRPAVSEGNIMNDLEKMGAEIDYLSDADRKTKAIWKKAGFNPDDEDAIILYSYVNNWPETKQLLDKSKIKYKELEDPNSAGESFIVFVNEMSSEKDGTKASDGKHKHEDHLEEDIEGMWKKTYGENFASKYPGIAKIIRQRKNIDARELARIWDETYGENFKEEYPAMWDALSK